MLYYLLAGIGWTLAALPQGALEAACRGLGWLLTAVPSRRRRTLASNLQHAFPDKSPAWRQAMAIESTRRTLEMGLFVLASPYFSRARLLRQFSVDEDLRRLIKERSAHPEPLVILTPHFCLMETTTLLPLLVADKMPPIGAVYRPFDIPALERWAKQTRERWGLRLLSRKEGFFQSVDLLRAGGSVTVLFDQNAGDRGALTLFFGRVCSTSELAGLLAEKCRARVGMIYAERQGFMRAVIRGEYLDVPQQADAVLFASNRWLENKLRQNENLCADWLWMHSRWRHQDNVARRFRLESKHNLLAGQLAALGETTLPRRTRFFIRLPNWLGDVVMALPLLRALRLSRPDAELTLLTQPAFVPLLERLGVGDRCIALPPQDTAYFGLFWEMRHEYPDTHILFTNSVRGDFEARVAGAPQRFGMVRPGLSRPLLTHSWVVPADLDETKEHQTRVWEKFFQNFGLKQELDLTSFQWSAPATEPAPHHTAPVIGFICGTENTPEKRWPVEHWRELANAILGAHPAARIQLFGTSRDAAITAAVAEGFPPERVVNRAGKTTLLEFAEALSGCAAIVCNDTGGMHLANALGVPVIAVYGPTNPIRTGPIFDGTHIILQPPGCPPTGGAPLASLSVAPVLAAVEATLARSRG